MAAPLHPIVYWAQKAETITLRVDLKDVKDPEIQLTKKSLTFKGVGIGAAGLNSYQFTLEFLKEVDPEGSAYRITDREVNFVLMKVGASVQWPKLTLPENKEPWLKIDFDKWTVEDDSEDDELRRKAEFEKDQLKQIEKQLTECEAEAYADFKKMYLCLYNFIQFIGFSYIFIYLLVNFVIKGQGMKQAYSGVIFPLSLCQCLSILEIIHPLVGLVKTGAVAPLIQVTGRNVVLFAVIRNEARIESEPIVCYLFLVWSSIELVRYPFYMLTSIGQESVVISWLRYTLWIPLYPAGLLSEILTLWTAIPFYEVTQRFCIKLPNVLNISFDMVTYLYIHIAAILIAAPTMMSHMWRQRQKRFGSKKKIH
ncbi:very-long-chain (3R)-3-hydroxyacyl-CoA dehydratase-like [Anneissia japonica]|uniref:very-long-chain (3R)-3-hydroxyacyl-CoA dehydratase-like n=1 Tax=Anneissia japonica TaxID=1529436 RepID=UPI0014257112|nr:very-long-chain (3R)-3-hydroxyacyl-CoA dehydratase-like [Anneissia japonica]